MTTAPRTVAGPASRRARRLAVVVLAVLAITAAACGDTDGGGGGTAAVTIVDFAYEPASVEVTPGTTVTWTNEDMFGHTVTSGQPNQPDGRFDGRLGTTTDGRGKTFSFTFDEPGTYAYFCDFHPTMVGEVVVATE